MIGEALHLMGVLIIMFFLFWTGIAVLVLLSSVFSGGEPRSYFDSAGRYHRDLDDCTKGCCRTCTGKSRFKPRRNSYRPC